MSDNDVLDSTAVDRLARVAIKEIDPDEVKSPALKTPDLRHSRRDTGALRIQPHAQSA